MKILMVLDRPNLYGSELHFLDLASHFAQVAEVKVIVLADGPLLPMLTGKNILYTIIPSGWLSFFSFYKHFRKILTEFSPHLVHSHQPKANFLVSLAKARLSFANVITIHSQAIDHALVHTSSFRRKIVFLFHKGVQYVSERQASRIVYVTKAASSSAFFKNKVVVLHNWLGKHRMHEAVARKPVSGVVRLVSIGSVTYSKGFDLMVEFVKRFDAGKFHLDVLGSNDSPFAIDLQNRLDTEGVKSITFHGYNLAIDEWLNRADFFVLFSRSETFGLSYIEAMAVGLPVLALDYPTMREVIPAGNSLSNNPEDHVRYLQQLTQNNELYASVSQTNRQFVLDNYSFSAAMTRYDTLYKSVAEQAG